MNARTTICGIFSMLVMLLVLLAIGSLFYSLPKAALGAIIFIALKGLFVQVSSSCFAMTWFTNDVYAAFIIDCD
jgi:MFS superfamily sulfate permease-like transporter